MKLTIAPEDGTIIIDGKAFTELDFSEGEIEVPDDIHALQWEGVNGEIEYVDRSTPNEQITILPMWAEQCCELHAIHVDRENNPPPLPPLTAQEIENAVVELRNVFLADTDWTVLVDSPFTDTQRTAWTTYRQSLRDLPSNEGYPWDGVYNYTNWPQPPVTGVVIEPTLNTSPSEWYNDDV